MITRFTWLAAMVLAIAAVTAPAPHATAADQRAPQQPSGGGTQTGPVAADGHDGHAKSGLLDVNWFNALWVVIIFTVLLAILYPTAWKNVLAGLKAREERIRADIAQAEATRAKAEATLREYNAQLTAAEGRARDMITAATADAQRVAAQIRAQGEQEAQEAKERATRDIDAARRQALAEIYEQTATLATSVAEKILRRNLNADDQRDLISTSLDQFQNLNNKN